MRMDWAKQRASLPVVIALSATSQDGIGTLGRPAFRMAFSISAGRMSGEPTILSRVSRFRRCCAR